MTGGDRGPFRPGERVLVPHTDKFYEAKVLKQKKGEDGVFYYLLHYQGWNKKWDEWVEAPGIVKFDRKLVDEEKKKSGGRTVRRKKPGELPNGSGNGLLPPAEGEPQLSLEVPHELKRLLMEDYERVVRKRQPTPLPRPPVVATILELFVEACKQTGESINLDEEVAFGLRVYFDKALRKMLLYEEEWEQHDQEVARYGLAASWMYGAEHLLRLFTKLPELMPVMSLSHNQQQHIEAKLAQVLDFLVENKDQFFPRPRSTSCAGSLK